MKLRKNGTTREERRLSIYLGNITALKILKPRRLHRKHPLSLVAYSFTRVIDLCLVLLPRSFPMHFYREMRV